MGKLPLTPRCLSRTQAASYLGISALTIDRLIKAGKLPVVRLPATTDPVANGSAYPRLTSRRLLIDIRDLDTLVEQSKALPEL